MDHSLFSFHKQASYLACLRSFQIDIQEIGTFIRGRKSNTESIYLSQVATIVIANTAGTPPLPEEYMRYDIIEIVYCSMSGLHGTGP